MLRNLFLFIFIFSLTGRLCAQDTVTGTIRVKKNGKVMKRLDVFNYPRVNSKQAEGLLTETEKYDEKGNIFLRSNFYNNTNETYTYNSKGSITGIRTYNTYLKSYMYQDSLMYDEKYFLIGKIRFRFNKLNAGGKDLGGISTKAINYVPDSVLFLETYRNDTSGKMINKTNKKGKEFSYFTYAYDSAGEQVRERGVNVIGNDSFIVINTTTYNGSGEPVKYVTKNAGGEILRTSINKFDSKGNKLETLVYNGSFDMIQKFEFAYDKEGNLTEQYCYDYKYEQGKKEATRSSESKIKYVREFW